MYRAASQAEFARACGARQRSMQGDRKKSTHDLTRQPITRSGWVQKKSDSSRRNWKRRFLVLRGNKLLYFTKEVDEHALVSTKPKGSISIFNMRAEW